MRKPRESSTSLLFTPKTRQPQRRLQFLFFTALNTLALTGGARQTSPNFSRPDGSLPTCCAGCIVPMHCKDIFRVDKNITILCSFLRRTFSRLTSHSRTLSQMAAPGPIDPRLQYAPPASRQYPP